MRRGVTLLEMLLALALVLALTAIALPAMLARREAEQLERTAEAIEAQLLLARSYAMVEGIGVEVRFDPSTRLLRVNEVGALPATDGEREVDGEFGEDEPNALPASVSRSWSELLIEDLLTISNEEPASLSSEADEAIMPDVPVKRPEFSDLEIAAPRATPSETVLFAAFLPDGSAPVNQTIWLTNESGRVFRIDIGRWTGIPHIDRQPVLQDDPTVEPEEAREEEAEREAVAAEREMTDPDPPASDEEPAASDEDDAEEGDEEP